MKKFEKGIRDNYAKTEVCLALPFGIYNNRPKFPKFADVRFPIKRMSFDKLRHGTDYWNIFHKCDIALPVDFKITKRL